MTLSQRAEKARKELFARYDQLNTLLGKHEERLARYHIPRPVEHSYAKHDIEEQNPNSGFYYERLGMQKVKGKWRLCYGSFDYNECALHDWTPLVECSVEVRVAAVQHIAALERKVVESAEKFIPKVDGAIKALTDLLEPDAHLAELLAERAKLNGDVK